jgi:hypothetical protein
VRAFKLDHRAQAQAKVAAPAANAAPAKRVAAAPARSSQQRLPAAAATPNQEVWEAF